MTDDSNAEKSDLHEQAPSSRHQVEFHPQRTSVSEAILTAVASLKQVEESELPILNDAIDPDALNELFEPKADGTSRTSDVTMFFTYAGYEIRLGAEGVITLSPTNNEEK